MKLKLETPRSQGMATFITVVIIAVIGLTLVAYLSWSETHTTLEMRSQIWNSALPIAEAGIEEAMAHLNSGQDRAADGWTLNGTVYVKQRTFGDGSYSVSIDTNPAPTILSAGFARMPPGNTYISRTVAVSCRRQSSGVGILAKTKITLSGTNSIVDSFDSTVAPYSFLTHKAGAVLMSNGGTTGSVDIGTAQVYGKAATGPGGIVTVDGVNGGSLGDLSWHAFNNTGIQTGTTSDDVNASFPSNSPPAAAFFAPAGGTVLGTNYTYVLDTASYKTTKFIVGAGGSAIVTGHAELYVTSDFVMSGSGYMWIAPGASLKIYVNGKFAVSGSGIANGTGQAANLTLLGLNGNTSCGYSGSSAFVGTINCPAAAVAVSGSGGLYGTVTGNTIVVSGGAGVHYDEGTGQSGRYVVESWNEWSEL
jgi:hypothetical protein